MSLPPLRPLLLAVGATSLVFFGGVIALAVQSPEPTNTSLAPNLITQNTGITSASSDLLSFEAASDSLSQSSLTSQLPLAALNTTQAVALAKQGSSNAVLRATPELVNYDGTIAYEVLLDSGTTYIDANLGTILNPVATNNYRVDDFDDDYDDYEEDYEDNERLIATSYQQHDEDDYDD